MDRILGILGNVTFQDWATWFITNLLGIFGPFVGTAIARGMKNQFEEAAKAENKLPPVVELFSSYKHGQLGYVAMAWCLAAIAELFRSYFGRSTLTGHEAVVGLLLAAGLIFLATFSIYVAALGAATQNDYPKAKTLRERWDEYFGFRVSVKCCAAALGLAGCAHYIAIPVVLGGGH